MAWTTWTAHYNFCLMKKTLKTCVNTKQLLMKKLWIFNIYQNTVCLLFKLTGINNKNFHEKKQKKLWSLCTLINTSLPNFIVEVTILDLSLIGKYYCNLIAVFRFQQTSTLIYIWLLHDIYEIRICYWKWNFS
jgi:hypothetical protein